MKLVTIEAMFPELKGGNIYKVARGEGSNAKAATSRAFGNLFKQVKGKRFTTVKCTVYVVEKATREVLV
jgi:hypothetical protein